jgi:molybdenum cofactor cytidylyltransferase
MEDLTGNRARVPPSEECQARIQPIILAAGNSERMGYPKALLPLGDDTFLNSILKTLAGLNLPDALVILGKDAEMIRSRIPGAVGTLVNPNPALGQLSSIKLALSAIDMTFSGCLIWPVDQPGIPASLVNGLVRLFTESGSPLVLPCYRGKRGHPAVFGRELFSELMEVPLERGPKDMVARHQHEIELLSTDEEKVVRDIDTPEDYYALTGETLEAALARLGVR